MKPKGLAVDKDSSDYKKILELSADSDLLASVDPKKGKFLSYLKNKLAPIQEEKQEKRCICFSKSFFLVASQTLRTALKNKARNAVKLAS